MKKNPFSQKRYFAFTAIGAITSVTGIATHSIEAVGAGIFIYIICLLGPLVLLHQSGRGL